MTEFDRLLTKALKGSSKIVSPWISVKDRLPVDESVVMVYTPAKGNYDESYDFDWYEDGCWIQHQDHYDHYIVVGGPKFGPGPSETAPYTHWMPIPPPPKD